MEVLQREREGTEVISVRVPRAVHSRLVELRGRAKQLGFNFNATLAEVLSRAARQIHEELAPLERRVAAGRGAADRAGVLRRRVRGGG
jgi:hypothetical protein